MSADDTLVEDVTIGAESKSGLAVLVMFLGEDEPRWVPLSLVSYMERSKTKGCDKIKIASWWLLKEGLEE